MIVSNQTLSIRNLVEAESKSSGNDGDVFQGLLKALSDWGSENFTTTLFSKDVASQIVQQQDDRTTESTSAGDETAYRNRQSTETVSRYAEPSRTWESNDRLHAVQSLSSDVRGSGAGTVEEKSSVDNSTANTNTEAKQGENISGETQTKNAASQKDSSAAQKDSANTEQTKEAASENAGEKAKAEKTAEKQNTVVQEAPKTKENKSANTKAGENSSQVQADVKAAKKEASIPTDTSPKKSAQEASADTKAQAQQQTEAPKEQAASKEVKTATPTGEKPVAPDPVVTNNRAGAVAPDAANGQSQAVKIQGVVEARYESTGQNGQNGQSGQNADQGGGRQNSSGQFSVQGATTPKSGGASVSSSGSSAPTSYSQGASSTAADIYAVKSQGLNGTLHRLNLKIASPELGSLRMMLQVKGDSVKALFVTEGAVQKTALESAFPSLRQGLNDQGLVVQDLSVQVGANGGGGSFQSALAGDGKTNKGGFRTNGGKTGSNESDALPTEAPVRRSHYDNQNLDIMI